MPAIYVIGVGPGVKEYLIPSAARAIQAARAVVGGQRHVSTFARSDQKTFIIKNNLPAAVDFIRCHQEEKVAVLASGDPGLYGVLAYLRRYFTPEELQVIPGISAMQMAFARLAMPWHDVVLLSAHGRELKEVIETIRRHSKVALFTDRQSTPAAVAQLMASAGIVNRRIYCCRQLGYPGEEIFSGTVDDFCRRTEPDPDGCVLVITDE